MPVPVAVGRMIEPGTLLTAYCYSPARMQEVMSGGRLWIICSSNLCRRDLAFLGMDTMLLCRVFHARRAPFTLAIYRLLRQLTLQSQRLGGTTVRSVHVTYDQTCSWRTLAVIHLLVPSAVLPVMT